MLLNHGVAVYEDLERLGGVALLVVDFEVSKAHAFEPRGSLSLSLSHPYPQPPAVGGSGCKLPAAAPLK